jgi:hypothetical protein
MCMCMYLGMHARSNIYAHACICMLYDHTCMCMYACKCCCQRASHARTLTHMCIYKHIRIHTCTHTCVSDNGSRFAQCKIDLTTSGGTCMTSSVPPCAITLALYGSHTRASASKSTSPGTHSRTCVEYVCVYICICMRLHSLCMVHMTPFPPQTMHPQMHTRASLWNMCVCRCACMHACMYMYVCMRMVHRTALPPQKVRFEAHIRASAWNMCACMYIHMYVCMYACVWFTGQRFRLKQCVSRHTFAHICGMCVCVRAYMHVYVCIPARYASRHTCTYIHICTHTYIHAHTCT